MLRQARFTVSRSHLRGMSLLECLLASALSTFLIAVLSSWLSHLHQWYHLFSALIEVEERTLVLNALLNRWFAFDAPLDCLPNPSPVRIESEGENALLLIARCHHSKPDRIGLSPAKQSGDGYALYYRAGTAVPHDNILWLDNIASLQARFLTDHLLRIDVQLQSMDAHPKVRSLTARHWRTVLYIPRWDDETI